MIEALINNYFNSQSEEPPLKQLLDDIQKDFPDFEWEEKSYPPSLSR